MTNRKMGTIALLFGTGQLMLGVAMHGWAQIGMFAMAGLSYFVMLVYFRINQVEELNKEERTKHNITFANLERFK